MPESNPREFDLLQLKQPESMPQGYLIRKAETEDLEIVRELADRSEGYNPFLKPGEKDRPMNTEELKRWMDDRDTGMMRLVLKGDKAIGFTYMYNDAAWDTDFARRAQILQNMQGLPADYPVWEMNFWFDEGTEDAVVRPSVEKTLFEFAQKYADKKTLVYFADQGDLRSAWQDATESPRKLLGAWSQPKIEIAKAEYQDTRILEGLGFKQVAQIPYLEGGAKDFAFAATFGGGSLPTPAPR